MPRFGNPFHDSVSFYTLTSDESSVYEVDIIERFSKVPVFTLSDVSQVITNRDYAKKLGPVFTGEQYSFSDDS